MGIGETMADFLNNPTEALRMGDLKDVDVLRRKLLASQAKKQFEIAGEILKTPTSPAISSEWALLNDRRIVEELVERYQAFTKLVRIVDGAYLPSLMAEGTTIFEGAQGVLLDQNFGFHPHTTWTDTTFGNAVDLLSGFTGEITKLGILRSHTTRHGAGPFPTEDPTLKLPNDHNNWGEWQQSFRVGHLDLALTRYAIEAIGGVDEIALTHLDLFPEFKKVCVSYRESKLPLPKGLSNTTGRLRQQEENGKSLRTKTPVFREFSDVAELISGVESLKASVTICSYGPTAKDKKARSCPS